MAWFLAVLLVLGSIVALLLARRLLGPLATRIVGGVLVLVGLGAVLRHFVTYWLPAAEVYVPALLVLAALGLVAVLTGGQAGLGWGGLSAASGLLAVGLVVAESSQVPGVGSYQRDMLNVAATSLGFVAVATALGAAGRGGSRVVGLAGATLAAIGMVVTAVAAYRLYPVYSDAGEQPTMIAIAGVAVLALLVLAVVLARKAAQVAPRDVRGSELRRVPPSRQPQPAPLPQRPNRLRHRWYSSPPRNLNRRSRIRARRRRSRALWRPHPLAAARRQLRPSSASSPALSRSSESW